LGNRVPSADFGGLWPMENGRSRTRYPRPPRRTCGKMEDERSLKISRQNSASARTQTRPGVSGELTLLLSTKIPKQGGYPGKVALIGWALGSFWPIANRCQSLMANCFPKSFRIGILRGITAKIAGFAAGKIAGSGIFIGFFASRIAQTRETLGSHWDTPL
jgi:hypothetical protein